MFDIYSYSSVLADGEEVDNGTLYASNGEALRTARHLANVDQRPMRVTNQRSGEVYVVRPGQPASQVVTATLVRRETADGFQSVEDHVQLGEQYQIELSTRRLAWFEHLATGERFQMEIVDTLPDGRWYAAELLDWPGKGEQDGGTAAEVAPAGERSAAEAAAAPLAGAEVEPLRPASVG